MIIKNKNTSTRREFVIGSGSAAIGLGVLNQAKSMTNSSNSLALAEDKRSELVNLLRSLIQIRSQTGESADKAQLLVNNYLSDLPYRIEKSMDRPSLYRSHPEFMPPNPSGDGPFVNIVGWPRNNTNKTSAIFSHIDTHTEDPGWETDPYKPIIKNNRMYGLGTSDDKGGVAAMLIAAKILSENDKPLPVVMSLHGKGGGSRGSLPVFERIRKQNNNIQSVLYAHPAETGRGLEDIKNAVLGVLDLELRVNGWRGPQMEIGSIDSSDWKEGGDAIETAMQFMDYLEKNILQGIELNLGKIVGGDRIGSVPDKVTINFRLKFKSEHNWMDLLKKIQNEGQLFIDKLSQGKNKFKINILTKGYRTNPGEAKWNGRESLILRDSITEITGTAPKSYPNHYAGDIRYPIRLLGVPAYGIGSLGGNFYGPNEWVDIDDLVKLTAVLVETVNGWSGKSI